MAVRSVVDDSTFPKDRKRLRKFYIPKSCVINVIKKMEYNAFGEKVIKIELTMDSYLFYKFTWKKIQDWMVKNGYKVKQWSEYH